MRTITYKDFRELYSCNSNDKRLGAINVGLCANRHDMAKEVTQFIFPRQVSPTDTIGLEDRAVLRLKELAEHRSVSETHLYLYVTGLTVALMATVNAAKKIGIKDITLMHWDKVKNEYYPQDVL